MKQRSSVWKSRKSRSASWSILSKNTVIIAHCLQLQTIYSVSTASSGMEGGGEGCAGAMPKRESRRAGDEGETWNWGVAPSSLGLLISWELPLGSFKNPPLIKDGGEIFKKFLNSEPILARQETNKPHSRPLQRKIQQNRFWFQFLQRCKADRTSDSHLKIRSQTHKSLTSS